MSEKNLNHDKKSCCCVDCCFERKNKKNDFTAKETTTKYYDKEFIIAALDACEGLSLAFLKEGKIKRAISYCADGCQCNRDHPNYSKWLKKGKDDCFKEVPCFACKCRTELENLGIKIR
ncbi:hypothetical protein HYV49_05290 [Candidatus Pacearchaeota archaeon]|nr:hypothetical protein [Candidatus Pacearchaeota archaeon]